MVSAVEGAVCSDTVMDGLHKTDRFDPLKLTQIMRQMVPLVDRVKKQIKELTRDIFVPSQEPGENAGVPGRVVAKEEVTVVVSKNQMRKRLEGTLVRTL